MSEAIRPEDVLADGVDGTSFGDVEVRKGSVAAFVANARAIETCEPGTAEYERLAAALVELVPALRAVGVLDVFAPRSERLAALIAAA